MHPLSYQKLHFGPSRSELHVGVDVDRMRRERADRMRDVLRSHDIPAILVAGADNVRYLTGFWWGEFSLQVGYALFFAEGETVLFAPAGSLQQMPDQAPWISQWRPAIAWLGGVAPRSAIDELSGDFAAQIRDELAAHSLTGERLAVSEIDAAGMAALAKAGIATVPGLPLLLEKSDDRDCRRVAASPSLQALTRWDSKQRGLPCVLGRSRFRSRRWLEASVEDAGAEIGCARFCPDRFPTKGN